MYTLISDNDPHLLSNEFAPDLIALVRSNALYTFCYKRECLSPIMLLYVYFGQNRDDLLLLFPNYEREKAPNMVLT